MFVGSYARQAMMAALCAASTTLAVPAHARQVDVPLRLDQSMLPFRSAAPRLGEHTRCVLREVGLDDAEIEALVDRRLATEW